MKRWHVESTSYNTLESALNRLCQAGHTIFQIIPHRQKQIIVAEIVSYSDPGAAASPLAWQVSQANYGPPLADALNALEAGGWSIFEVIPHREQQRVFAEIIAFKPR